MTALPVPATEPPSRKLCTDCGLSRTAQPQRCGQACQFIRPDYPRMERQVHGRARVESPVGDAPNDELHFGPLQTMWQAQLREPLPGAQWSGITTRLAERLLESGAVDAVICMGPHPEDRWRPQPVVVTRAQDMSACRGMRMGYAPLLEQIEPALRRGLRRLAVIGIPCQVYPLRAIEDQLRREHGLQSLHVIGLPCSDNTHTERFHEFLALLSPRPEEIGYLEFRADYQVEIRTDAGQRRLIPFLQLPLSDLPADFFPTTCRTCVDYTNALADITVGYMGGSGEQWVLVRNKRGQQLLDLLGDEVVLTPTTSAGRRAGAVRGFLANLQRAAGGLPTRRMPGWVRPLVAWLMPRIGPRGLEFARARVEMKALETLVHLRRDMPARVRSMVPEHVFRMARDYGLVQAPHERPAAAPRTPR